MPVLFQDPGKIRQILTNLLSNAVKFTPEGGRIRALAGRTGDQLLLQVQDTGIGIPEPDRAIIFEKFRQAPSAIGVDALTRKHSGTGLGLSIVRELCILLGGSVEVESEIGKGSTFSVILPLRYESQPGIRSEITDQIDELTHNHRTSYARPMAPPETPAATLSRESDPLSPEQPSGSQR